MQRIAIIIAAVVAVVVIGGYAFRTPLMAAIVDKATANMFVTIDNDPFDPGAAIGQPLPALHARFQGREITDLKEFMGQKGLVLFLNRSVDW